MRIRQWAYGTAVAMAMVWLGGCGGDDSDGAAEANASTETLQAGSQTNAQTTATNATGQTNAQTTTVVAAATNARISVTGTYTFKRETMALKQNGNALTGSVVVAGFVQDPAHPIQLPVPVVGSVDALGIVELQELLIYPLDHSRDFVIEKAGSFSDANTLVLNVIKGQTPQTQIWIRQK